MASCFIPFVGPWCVATEMSSRPVCRPGVFGLCIPHLQNPSVGFSSISVAHESSGFHWQAANRKMHEWHNRLPKEKPLQGTSAGPPL